MCLLSCGSSVPHPEHTQHKNTKNPTDKKAAEKGKSGELLVTQKITREPRDDPRPIFILRPHATACNLTLEGGTNIGVIGPLCDDPDPCAENELNDSKLGKINAQGCDDSGMCDDSGLCDDSHNYGSVFVFFVCSSGLARAAAALLTAVLYAVLRLMSLLLQLSLLLPVALCVCIPVSPCFSCAYHFVLARASFRNTGSFLGGGPTATYSLVL